MTVVKNDSKKLNVDSKKEALLKKFQSTLGKKEIAISSNQSIYKMPKHILEDDKKKKSFRRNIRTQLKKYINKIVISGAVNANLFKDIDSFLLFYKENYLLNDFKIESFTTTDNNKANKILLLSKAKEYLELKN